MASRKCRCRTESALDGSGRSQRQTGLKVKRRTDVDTSLSGRALQTRKLPRATCVPTHEDYGAILRERMHILNCITNVLNIIIHVFKTYY